MEKPEQTEEEQLFKPFFPIGKRRYCLIAQGGLIVSDPDDRQHWVEFHLGRSSCGRMWEIELAVSESARWVVYRGQIPDQETFTTIMRNVESSPSNFGAEIGQVAASRYGTSHPLRNGDL